MAIIYLTTFKKIISSTLDIFVNIIFLTAPNANCNLLQQNHNKAHERL